MNAIAQAAPLALQAPQERAALVRVTTAEENPLAPMRGIAIGLAIVLPLWIAGGAFVVSWIA